MTSTIKSYIKPLTFKVPLALAAHRRAKEFQQHQANLTKAKQVYFNTLAVYAVNFYLRCMGFETNLEESDSWNPVMQTLMDVADLTVKNHGKLECRLVLPEAKCVKVPAAVWQERIGYVAVELDQALEEASLVGFADTVITEELPLNQLRTLKELPPHIREYRQSPLSQAGAKQWSHSHAFKPKVLCTDASPSNTMQTHPTQQQQPQNQTPVVRLKQWLENSFEADWKTVETILPPAPEPMLDFRSFPFDQPSKGLHTTVGVKRGKLLGSEIAWGAEKVALFVELHPTDSPKMNIFIELFPPGGADRLPKNLQIMVLDHEGIAVIQTQARETENIKLQVSGEPGEHFSIKLVLNDVSITENFLI
ncbi:MAG: DUF1822 family protein [Moorea sp. SIO4G2]|nr:DUF1822 family protein [Moorena sp. SIO4G2]